MSRERGFRKGSRGIHIGRNDHPGIFQHPEATAEANEVASSRWEHGRLERGGLPL